MFISLISIILKFYSSFYSSYLLLYEYLFNEVDFFIMSLYFLSQRKHKNNNCISLQAN